MRTEVLRTEDVDQDLGRIRYGTVRNVAARSRNYSQNAQFSAEYARSRIKQRPDAVQYTARAFQMELFNRAKEQNIIAVVDTGSGKSYVASLLITDTVWKEEERRQLDPNYQHKLCFFVVDKVALAIQQALFLQKTCPGRIGLLIGEMGVDNYSKAQWAATYDEWDTIVLTADILKDCLARGLISMCKINLLIYDECHHARSAHAYALIQQFYHKTLKSLRPKIFGMTASPVSSKKNPTLAVAQLERLLDATICSPHPESSLSAYVVRPQESIVEYPKAAVVLIEPTLELAEGLLSTISTMKRFLSNVAIVTQELGAWAGILVWKKLIDDADWKLEAKSRLVSSSHQHHERDRLKQAKYLVDRLSYPPVDEVRSTLTPKVRTLLSMLKEIYGSLEREGMDDPVVICFCERRITAYALMILVSDLLKVDMPKALHASIFTGHGGTDEGDLSMPLQRQSLVVEAFRKGELNFLFATSVAEEGIDIPACNCVIRFDGLTSAIQYVQSRGRARKSNSKYFCFMEEGDLKAKAQHAKIQDLEKTIRAICTSLDQEKYICVADQQEEENIYNLVQSDDSKSDVALQRHLAGFAAVSVVEGFCRSLPYDEFVCTRASYKIISHSSGFFATCTFPAASEIPPITGSLQKSKRNAKIDAAQNAVAELQKRNLLDESYNPILCCPDSLDSEDENDSTPGKKEWPLRGPRFWCNNSVARVYLTRILSDRTHYSASLVLVTKNESLPSMPAFELFSTKESFHISLVNLETSLNLSSDQLGILCSFTNRLLRVIAHKKFVDDPALHPYFLAIDTGSTEPSDAIDWIEMEKSYYDRHGPITPGLLDTGLPDTIIKDFRHNTYYYTNCVRRDLKSESLLPPDDRRFKAHHQRSIRDQAMEQHRDVSLLDPEQPILEATQLRRVLNFLPSPVPLKPDEVIDSPEPRRKYYLIPELCVLVNIKASVVAMSFLIPSIMTRLDSHLFATELNDAMGTDIPLSMLVEAITTPQACHATHYERLEYLGDAYLKLISTLGVYLEFPGYHEGLLTVARTAIINNKTLRRQAIARKLYEVIRTQPFNKGQWRPDILLLEGEQSFPKRTHKIGNKQIADVVEAIIGAGVYSRGFDAGLKVACCLGVDTYGVSSWDDARKKYKAPHFLTKSRHVMGADLVAEKFQYEFANLGYLEQALRHGSCPVMEADPVPSYQRLELMGDAVLEMVVATYLYDKYPQYDPDRLTNMKSHLVRNKSLGSICEALGLQKLIRHFNGSVPAAIFEYSQELAYLRSRRTKVDYYSDCEPPKFMSDILESILGAMFIDSGFSCKPVEKVFHSCILAHLDPDIDYSVQVPAMAILNTIIQKFGCREAVIRKQQTVEHIPLDYRIAHKNVQPKSTFKLELCIHDHQFAQVETSTYGLAKLKLAELALEKLGDDDHDEHVRVLSSLCTCEHATKVEKVVEQDEFEF